MYIKKFEIFCIFKEKKMLTIPHEFSFLGRTPTQNIIDKITKSIVRVRKNIVPRSFTYKTHTINNEKTEYYIYLLDGTYLYLSSHSYTQVAYICDQYRQQLHESFYTILLDYIDTHTNLLVN